MHAAARRTGRWTAVLVAGTVGWMASQAVQAQTYKVLAWNDLGMHCYDSDFSMFSLLPPFNTVHAQVVKVGSTPTLLSGSQVNVYYSSYRDPSKIFTNSPSGSINTTSAGKTNFWTYQKMYGSTLNLKTNVGILGAAMPGVNGGNQPQKMTYDNTSIKWASGTGIPLTCIDDKGNFNPYPMMLFQAIPAGKTSVAASVPAVVPVSSEMDCKSCHATGGIAAGATQVQKYGMAQSTNANLDLQSRENVLHLHDAVNGTSLWQNRPVVCASCHYSPALDLAGVGAPSGTQVGHELLSKAMHKRHGRTLDNSLPTATNPPIIDPTLGVQACYKCHPGGDTNCLRSVMAGKLVSCQQCHGDLLSVAGEQGTQRTPWMQEPKCQSCHTGDFVNNLGGDLPRKQAYAAGDLTAAPILAPASRFAENPNKLYRFSVGHGGLACSACHGSPHAEWPAINPNANDNATPIAIQGHGGPVVECSACHGTSISNSLGGPHGMHPVNSSSFVSGHEDLVEKNGLAACQACHGLKLEGTYLSTAAAARTFRTETKTVSIAKGQAISCGVCHRNPINGGT